MDMITMVFVIGDVADAMVGKAFLPDQPGKAQFFLRPERKVTFNELYGLFRETSCDDEMKMVRYHDKTHGARSGLACDFAAKHQRTDQPSSAIAGRTSGHS